MLRIRKSAERGHADHGWLDTYHTFSFADYHDPREMGFSALRVINEDRVQPKTGFGTHGHRDMEIITYVLEGALEHKDSMGNGSIIRPGDVQRMSAGTGVTHSEFNHSQTGLVHLLQIWIEPNVRGVKPGYEEARFEDADKRNRLRLVASPDGAEGSVSIHQDARIFVTRPDAGAEVAHALATGRSAYVHVARGSAEVNGHPVSAGDGMKLSDERAVRVQGVDAAELLLFDLP
jgi:hypothetical protein